MGTRTCRVQRRPSPTSSTTVECSKPEPGAAKKEVVLIAIENQCTHFSFSLFVLEPGDGFPSLDQDELQDVPELEDDSEEDTEFEYP